MRTNLRGCAHLLLTIYSCIKVYIIVKLLMPLRNSSVFSVKAEQSLEFLDDDILIRLRQQADFYKQHLRYVVVILHVFTRVSKIKHEDSET